MHCLRHLLLAAAVAMSTACSQVPVGGQAAGDASTHAHLRLQSLTRLDRRVAEVAWRLSEANTDLCPATRSSAGWVLHAARLYSPELRPHAEVEFGVRGDLPGILAAPHGSPAFEAGLRTGDLLLAVNGAPLAEGERGHAASFAGFAENLRTVDAALAGGRSVFSVQRGQERLEIAIHPRQACGYDVQLDPSDELNARADGRRLFISTALAGFTQTDDELAVILGHELAHHVLRHRHWNDAGGAGRLVDPDEIWTDGGEGGPEQQADRVGLYLAARAGYDAGAAVPFWRRFGQSNWRVRFPQIGHPSAGARARALERVEREIETKRAEGQPLVP